MTMAVDFETSPGRPLLELASRLNEANVRSETRKKATHERFNVFTTLYKSHDEVRLHTRFIHCLLDPAGTHDCGDLFLRLFFQTLSAKPPLSGNGDAEVPMAPSVDDKWRVRREVSCDGSGRIDLLLERGAFGVAIENKIYAAEQDDQLDCYARHMSAAYGSGWVLLYLTLDGRQGVSGKALPYLCISYGDHILSWLEECLRETYHVVPVNQALLQYRAVVRELTGKTLESSEMKPITEFITKHPDLIRHRKQIKDALDVARVESAERFLRQVEGRLPDGYSLVVDGKMKFGEHVTGKFYVKPFPPHGPTLLPICVQEWEGSLVIGIELPRGSPARTDGQYDGINRLLEGKGYRNMKSEPDWPIGWCELMPFDDDRLAAIMTEGGSNAASELAESIKAHVELILSACAKSSGARS